MRLAVQTISCAIVVTGALTLSIACGDATGPQPDFFACEDNAQCIVVHESCCGTCGAATPDDATAVNVDAASDFSAQACDGVQGCPACAPLFIDPQLVATCRARRCQLIDLRKHEMTSCTRDADCKLRAPDCCECGGDTSLGRVLGIAAAAERDYATLVCDRKQACDQCAPIYPSEVSVECNSAGHCSANDARLP